MARLIEFQADALIKGLDTLRGAQLPYAGAQALKQLGWQLKQHHREWMASGGFENPVQRTLTSPKYEASGLELRFFLNTDNAGGQSASEYIYPVTPEGGTRKSALETRFNTKLKDKGILKKFAVPNLSGRGVRINKYGNMSPGQYAQVKEGLLNRPSIYFLLNERQGRLRPGIYQRRADRTLNNLFNLVSQVPRVNAKYDFFGITDTFAKERLPKLLSDALDRAIR